MDRDTPDELENPRHSIAMLSPGARARDREQALRVLADLRDAQGLDTYGTPDEAAAAAVAAAYRVAYQKAQQIAASFTGR